MAKAIAPLALLAISMLAFNVGLCQEGLKDIDGGMSLEEAIQKRRSQRSFSQKEISAEQIGKLLWAVQGITDTARDLRAAPSAGALYPLEIYVVKKDGTYHYKPHENNLTQISTKDLRPVLSHAALSQSAVREAPVLFVVTAVYERVTSKYGKRGIRYVDMEVGHAAQNLHLQAVSLGLGSVPIGAFDDSAVSKVLSLPEDHQPRYIIPVGYSR